MSAVHPSDQLYALERAIAVCTSAGEPSNVISDLRSMRDSVQRYARGESKGGLNLPNTQTGD
jgi:hypothetical protein